MDRTRKSQAFEDTGQPKGRARVMSVLAVAAVAFASHNAIAAELRLPAATTAEILLDGKIEGPEWSSAERLNLGSGVTVYALADSEFVALAAHSSGLRYADIFLARSDGKILNLHASMQTGERLLVGGNWTDTEPSWQWGNNTMWRASTVRRRDGVGNDEPFLKQMLPFDGQEFLLDRKMVKGDIFIRIEVRDFTGEKPDVVHPESSSRFDSNGWLRLILPSPK
ncbi:MAG: hypothetical protein KBA31_01995 [Alphaproteobacteria bacterium]|nr:hypothetical protein [Alphaproteobacteria bacterium]